MHSAKGLGSACPVHLEVKCVLPWWTKPGGTIPQIVTVYLRRAPGDRTYLLIQFLRWPQAKEPLCLWGGHPRLFEGGALSYSVPLLSKVMTGAIFMNQFFFYLLRCASVYLAVVSTCASIYNMYTYLNKYVVKY